MQASIEKPPPQPGDVFVIPLRKSCFCAAHLLDNIQGHRFLVYDAFWTREPSLAEVTNLQHMTDREYWSGEPEKSIFKGWICEDFPLQFPVIGHIPLTDFELSQNYSVGTTVLGRWQNAPLNLYKEWQWRYDRETLIADRKRARLAFLKKEDNRKKILSLDVMVRQRPFSHWSNYQSKNIIREARRIFREATKTLIELEIEKSPRAKKARIAILKNITDQLNSLDDETQCIETAEREELCDRIADLGRLVGLKDDKGQLTGHRLW